MNTTTTKTAVAMMKIQFGPSILVIAVRLLVQQRWCVVRH